MRQAILLVACLATPCAAQDLLSQSEPPIQARLSDIVRAFGSGGGLHLNVAATKELRELDDSIADKGEIVKQVAIFATGPGEAKPLAALAILQALDLPPEIVIRTLAPHLEAENPKLRAFVRNWFQGHDNGGAGDDPLKPVNFDDYVKYVRSYENPPKPFVEYIYDRSPNRALLVFFRADSLRDAVTAVQAEAREVEAARQEAGIQPLPAKAKGPDEVFVAEQIVSHAIRLKNWEQGKLLPEAKEHIAKLAEREEWWVRRYVVEVMRRHPELRQPEVIEKLSGDANESVSKTAKGAKG